VGLVDEDDVELLDGQRRVVDDGQRFPAQRIEPTNRTGDVASSASSAISVSPLSIEYSRWTVPMTTFATGSSWLLVRSCTLYSSMKSRSSSGVR
jgi:hypothetical protein